jgi:hypothetical protein
MKGAQEASRAVRESILRRDALCDRRTDIATTMALVPIPFHTAWANRDLSAPQQNCPYGSANASCLKIAGYCSRVRSILISLRQMALD